MRCFKINPKYIKTLEKSSLFQEIQANHIACMMHCLEPRITKYKKNDFIAIAGDEFKELGILLEGEAVVIKENAAGKRTMVMNMIPGKMFGSMVVFSGINKWPSTVKAQKDCVVFFLSKNKIITQCKKACPWHKQLIQNMLKITSIKAISLNKQLEYIAIKSMRAKLCTYILEQYKKNQNKTFDLPLKRNELAEYLNVSRPSMSREMSRMRDEGLIDYYRSTIKIKDEVALRSFANQ